MNTAEPTHITYRRMEGARLDAAGIAVKTGNWAPVWAAEAAIEAKRESEREAAKRFRMSRGSAH